MVTSHRKEHVRFTTSQRHRYVDGMQRVQSMLSEHLPDKGDMLHRSIQLLAAIVLMLSRREISVIVEFPQTPRKMISDVKRSSCGVGTLTIQLFKMLVRELIGSAPALIPFWNKRCEENSERLWLPTETDSVGSHLSSSNLFSNTTRSNSWFSIKTHKDQKRNLLQTSSQSYISSHTGKWGAGTTKKEVVGMKRVRFLPTSRQQKVLKEWMGTSRYTYNKAVHAVERENQKVNFYTIRDRMVPKHKIRKGKEWLLRTPKDIRADSIKDVVTAYKAAFANLKNGNIKKFRMSYRSRKHESSEWINVPKYACTPSVDGKTISLFKRFMKTPLVLKGDTIHAIDHDSKIHHNKQSNLWYFLIPMKHNSTAENQGVRKPVVSIDPGVKTFLTLYDPTGEVIKIAHDDMKTKIVPLYRRIDNLASVSTRIKSKRTKRNLSIRMTKLRARIKNWTLDIHTRSALLLVKRYDTVLIPDMNTSRMVVKMNGARNRRTLLGWSHYAFLQRLKYYGLKHGCNVQIVTEEYTSKTCGCCGSLHSNLSNSDMYKCTNCSTVIDRDTNGARNILLKNLM